MTNGKTNLIRATIENSCNSKVLFSKFARVVLRAVQDAKDDDVLSDDAEKDFVGKTMGEDAAKTPVVKREAFGIGFQSQKRFGVVGEKFIAESGASLFIPVVRATEVGLGLRPDGEDPIHRDLRISLKTLRHGSPGLGSRSNSANASSSACRSAAFGALPSNKSAS